MHEPLSIGNWKESFTLTHEAAESPKTGDSAETGRKRETCEDGKETGDSAAAGNMPVLETIMLNRLDIPSLGAGETPILAIAPAIRNAIASATGKRLYALPLIPNGLKA